MLRFTALLSICPLAALLAAPAAAQPVEPGSSTTGNKVYALTPVKGSTESGTVALQPFGRQTEIEIHLLHWKSTAAQPANINAGTCAEPASKVKYALKAVREGFSETLLGVPIAQLANAGLSVNVQGAACANL
jgi:hypothetical protein